MKQRSGHETSVTTKRGYRRALASVGARAVAGVALVSMAVLAGCSSNMPSDASGAGHTQSAAGSSANKSADSNRGASKSATKAQEEYNLKFAKCMREAGVNVPDDLQNYGPGEDFGVDANTWNAAVQGCWKKVGDSPTAGTDSEMTEQEFDRIVRVAQCLRKDGYNVDDPVRGQGIKLDNVPPGAISQCFDKVDAASGTSGGAGNSGHSGNSGTGAAK